MGPTRRPARARWILVRAVVGPIALVAAYYLRPGADGTPLTIVAQAALTALIVVGALVGGVMAITRSPYPRLRAAEVGALVVTLMVVSFATVYVTMSERSPRAFSEEMNRTGALYFTMTTLATVGYGDIHARTDPARIVVMAQMVFNVVVIGAALKLIAGTARRRVGGSEM